MGVGAPLVFAYVLMCDSFVTIPNCQTPTGLEWANTGQTPGKQPSKHWANRIQDCQQAMGTRRTHLASQRILCLGVHSARQRRHALVGTPLRAAARQSRSEFVAQERPFWKATSERETLETPHEGRLCAQL